MQKVYQIIIENFPENEYIGHPKWFGLENYNLAAYIDKDVAYEQLELARKEFPMLEFNIKEQDYD